MGKIAFVFSGQGAQFAGMGKSFYENVPKVRELFDRAEALRPDTLEQCFSGDSETLRRTENTQPCLYLADLAAALALRNLGIEAAGVAGFSLGEIPALAFAGAYTYLEGFRIACRRGELMQKAADENPAAMAAVLRLAHAQVEAICEKYEKVFPVNYNSPQQLIVAGDKSELDAMKADVSAAGGKLLPLAVGGGFHSPLMDGASKRFGLYLENMEIGYPEITAYSNYTSKPYREDIRGSLEKQVNHPVRWEAIILDMYAAGYDTFIETGVGDTLKKLIGQIVPEARAFSADSWEKAQLVKELCNA